MVPVRLCIPLLCFFGVMLASCTEEPDNASAPLELVAPVGDVILEVAGAIATHNDDDRARFDLDMLRSLPPVTLATRTSVTDGVKQFEGFLLRDLLRGIGASGQMVRASALNDYVVDIPMGDVEKYDVIVAHSMDGDLLSADDKGPLWIVYPRDQHPELQDIRYEYRWVWQLSRLDIE